jgi:hypothetical protein
MRMNRIGAPALYASAPDEGMLFAAEQGSPIRALVISSDADIGAVTRLVDRIEGISSRAPALLFVAEGELAKPLLDLRSRCRIWSLREPLDDAQLQDVTRSALYGTPPGAAHRQHPRVPCDLMATVAVGDHSQAAMLSSLSIRGALLELAKRPPVEARVDVAFPLEDITIRAPATVLYHAGPAGAAPTAIGVLFDALPAESVDAIRTLVEQRSVRCLA